MLEQLILAILSEGSTTVKADEALQRLKDDYFDWNEVRVSAVIELKEVLSELPEPEHRSTRLKASLKHIFESLYSYDLESWRKSSIRDAAKRLSALPSASGYVTNRVIRDSLGGNAMPLDSTACRVLNRLEVFDGKTKPESMASSLERLIPKTKSFEFCHLLAELGANVCLGSDPLCLTCCLLEFCPMGQETKASAQAAAKQTTSRKRARTKASAGDKTRSGPKSKPGAKATKSKQKAKSKKKAKSK